MTPILWPSPEAFERAVELVELRAIARRAAADIRLDLALDRDRVEDPLQAVYDEREYTQLAHLCEQELKAIANAALAGSWA